MKAIVLCQPYASMVAGLIPGWLKSIETRTWPTSHRGDLLIVAGKNIWPAPTGYDGPSPRTLPRGVALCVVRVEDCHRMRPVDWAAACCDPYEKAWGWELVNVRRIKPFPVVGRQRIFEVPYSLESEPFSRRACPALLPDRETRSASGAAKRSHGSMPVHA